MIIMRWTARAAGLAAFLLLLTAQSAIAAPPIAAFGRLPFITDLKISPDGKHFAGIQAVSGRPSVVIYAFDAPPGSKPQICGFGDAQALGTIWVNDDRLICILSSTTNFHGFGYNTRFVRAVSVSVSGKPAAILMKGSQVYNYNLRTAAVSVAIDDPQHVYLAAYSGGGFEIDTSGGTRLDRHNFALSLFKVDVEDGHGSREDTGSKNTFDFVLDSHGKIVGRLDQSADLTGHLIVDNRDATTWDMSAGTEFDVLGLNAGDTAFAISRYGSGNTLGIDAFSRASKSFDGTMFRDPTYDMAYPLRDDWSGAVIGAAYASDAMQYQWIDPVRQKLQRSLQAAVPGDVVHIIGADRAGDAYLVSSESPRRPTTYYVYRTATHQMAILATEYPELQESDLGEMKPYPYKARDGLDIHAYLTLPPGKQPKNLPAVIFPHGGPDQRDMLGFDWMAQFMASRGYAVLQPNFRGSTGYGVQFRDAGFGEWGRAMQNDITDGVKKLIADGIVDPKRICIVGASYGGYAALAGATFTPDLYACAVSFAGVSDVEALLWTKTGAYTDSSVAGYWQARIGDRMDRATLRDRSPLRHVENVRAPILLVHADKDLTVPIEQSQAENAALSNSGRHVEFITLAGDSHYLELEQSRMQFLTHLERFLSTYIGN